MMSLSLVQAPGIYQTPVSDITLPNAFVLYGAELKDVCPSLVPHSFFPPFILYEFSIPVE